MQDHTKTPTVLETTPQNIQPENLSSLPPTEKQVQVPPKKGYMWVLISILLLVLSILGFAFVWFQNSMPQTPNTPVPTTTQASPSPAATPFVSVSPTDSTNPEVVSPLPNTKVQSPLTVMGMVPPGWMFEGQVVLKLLDNNKNLIVQGAGKEKTPGSWTSGEPVDFEGTLTFSTTVPSGFLVIENDNPSGLPENQKSFEIPVTF